MGGFKDLSSLPFLELHATYLQQPFALQKPQVLACCSCLVEHQCAAGLSSPKTNLMETIGVQGTM